MPQTPFGPPPLWAYPVAALSILALIAIPVLAALPSSLVTSGPAYTQVPRYLQPNGGKPEKGNKYGAVPTVVDGIRFDSKREARYYETLKARLAAGEIRYFLRQVPLHLPGGTKLVVDFLVVELDGRNRFIDAKGRETATFKVKRREVEHHYPVEIELV